MDGAEGIGQTVQAPRLPAGRGHPTCGRPLHFGAGPTNCMFSPGLFEGFYSFAPETETANNATLDGFA